MVGSGKEESDHRHAHGKSPFISDSYLNLNLKKKQIKAVESPITRIFGGRFKSTLRAPGQRDSVLTEDWRSLRLDIQVSSASASSFPIDDICHCPARYSPHDSRSPNPPNSPPTHPNDTSFTTGVTIDANQRVLIDALPPVLVLHVKRFCYDVSVGGVVKVMKQVRFGPELEIGPGMCVLCPCRECRFDAMSV